MNRRGLRHQDTSKTPRFAKEHVFGEGFFRGACSKGWGPALAILVIAGSLAACSPSVTSNGHRLDQAALAQITPGKTSRQEVLQLLGSPSSIAPFDDRSWYYVNQRIETRSFYQQEMVDQNVLTITFDDNGRVVSVNRHDIEQAAAIEPVDRTTPTAGKKPSIVEQLISNVGRFGDTPPDAGPGGD